MHDEQAQHLGPPEPPRRRGPTAKIVVAVVVLAAVAGGGWALGRRDRHPGAPRAAEGGTTPTTGAEDPLAALGKLFGRGSDAAGGNPFGDLDPMALAGCAGADALQKLLTGGHGDIPDTDARSQIAAIARWDEQQRHLRFDHVPDVAFVTKDEMRTQLEAQLQRDYPDDVARADTELYTALGEMRPGTDAKRANLDLLSAQVQGFYDPQAKKLVVLGDPGTPLDGLTQVVVAHELEHALADQNLHLPISTRSHDPDPDRDHAAHALAEGDAVLIQNRFTFEEVGLTGMLESAFSGDLFHGLAGLDAAPRYLAHQLMFPYTAGLSFVCGLDRQGGSGAIDGAYARPPASTAQVMFPDRYAAHEQPVPAPAPAAPAGDGWAHVRRITFGAADLEFLLEDAGITDAKERASGWAGGAVEQWRRGTDVAVRVSLAARDDSGSLCGALRAWADRARGGRVTCDRRAVQVAIGG